MSTPKFKVVTANSQELFEERLDDFIQSMDRDEAVVDVEFATCPLGSGVEFSALIQYRNTAR